MIKGKYILHTYVNKADGERKVSYSLKTVVKVRIISQICEAIVLCIINQELML